jgi:hypothetical protein
MQAQLAEVKKEEKNEVGSAVKAAIKEADKRTSSILSSLVRAKKLEGADVEAYMRKKHEQYQRIVQERREEMHKKAIEEAEKRLHAEEGQREEIEAAEMAKIRRRENKTDWQTADEAARAKKAEEMLDEIDTSKSVQEEAVESLDAEIKKESKSLEILLHNEEIAKESNDAVQVAKLDEKKKEMQKEITEKEQDKKTAYLESLAIARDKAKVAKKAEDTVQMTKLVRESDDLAHVLKAQKNEEARYEAQAHNGKQLDEVSSLRGPMKTVDDVPNRVAVSDLNFPENDANSKPASSLGTSAWN